MNGSAPGDKAGDAGFEPFDQLASMVVLVAAALGAIAALFFAGRVIGRLGARNPHWTAERGPDDETQAEHGVQQTKASRALVLGRDVGV